MLKSYLNLHFVLTRRGFTRFTVEQNAGNIIQQKIILKNIEKTKDWQGLRDELLNNSTRSTNINNKNIDSATIKTCVTMKKYNLAIDYFKFLEKQNAELNLSTLSNFLKIFFHKYWLEGQSLDKKTEDTILEIYKKIRNMYPVLEPISLDNIILGLSTTKSWKICVDLLDEIEASSTPSTSAFSAVAAAAFLNNEEKLGWDLLAKMSELERAPHEVVYFAYFRKKGANLDDMFNFMQKNNFKLNPTSAEQITKIYKQSKQLKTTTVNNNGFCKNCNNKLNLMQITTEEFDELKKKIFTDVIIGRDIFTKTTPKEVEGFKDFIKKMPRFDVVIDGLNVAYSKGVKRGIHVQSFLVRSIVEHFVEQQQKVLILGRQHMQRWPQQDWSYITRNAGVFLTENLSQDDPYLLYCALNSGKNTKIITSDLMRTHKFKLGNLYLKGVFSRWLAENRWRLVTVTETGQVILQPPLPYSIVAQNVGGFWHIPIDTGDERGYQWLCIKQ